MSLIEVRQKAVPPNADGGVPTNSRFSTGPNTEILIDGKVIPYVTKFNLEIVAGEIAKATIEIVGSFAVNVVGDFEQKVFNVTPAGASDAKD